MPFTDHKLETFTKKISDLPDEPKLLPNELKAYFDSSPEELRQAHNDLCESLDQIQASAVHFTMTAGVPEENVQDAIENVQSQLDAAVMGNIPSGSVTGDKLAQDVRDRFSAIETAATTEASTRASADSNLQSQISTNQLYIIRPAEIGKRFQLTCVQRTENHVAPLGVIVQKRYSDVSVRRNIPRIHIR